MTTKTLTAADLKRPTIAYISADYDEFHPETLRGFDVTLTGGLLDEERKFKFESITAAAIFANSRANVRIIYSSTVEDYISDSRKKLAAEERLMKTNSLDFDVAVWTIQPRRLA